MFERVFFVTEEGERGYTTIGMVVAFLVTLSLIFAGAQVYRINTRAAAIQDVADAAALAAENQVGQFMVAVRVCDALVLSLSVTSLVVTGLGVVALCVPTAQSLGGELLDAGRNLSKARDSFSRGATRALTVYERVLPFLSAASAWNVAHENDDLSGDARYLALAVLVPGEGEVSGLEENAKSTEAQDAVDDQADDLAENARKAEESAIEAKGAKHRAYMADCGDNPGYCMYERAAALAGLSGGDNPLYTQEETWSFSVALSRARNYYQARLDQEAPQSGSVEEGARSALRKNVYRFACELMSQAYVSEGEDSFEAYLPVLPRNTDEMRDTPLYTEAVYPVTANDDGTKVMHAYEGCPNAAGATEMGSVSDLEQGDFTTCEACQFDAASLGSVCSASSYIDNGFEYHYRIVAEAAGDYQNARQQSDPANAEVKNEVEALLGKLKSALVDVGNARIDAEPAGRLGTIVLVVDTSRARADEGFESSFVQTDAALGTRAAVSGATLLADASDDQASVITAVLDDVRDAGGAGTGVLSVVLSCWNSCLYAYDEGQDAVTDGIEQALDQIPLASECGLGTWAAKELKGAIGDVGLQKADLDALKPVLVNTGLVAAEDDGGFAVRYLSTKRTATEVIGDAELFSSVVSDTEARLKEAVSGDLELATIQPLGDWGPSIPLTIVLPPEAQSASTDIIEQVADGVRSVFPSIDGEDVWR